MNETILLWILGVIVMALAALAGIIWRHVEHCKDVHEELAGIRADMKHVLQDIGTHDTGLRGTVHKTASAVQRIEYELRMGRNDER